MTSLGGAMNSSTATAPGVAGDAWYVVCTKRYAERVAQCYLQQAGIVSYLPRVLQSPPPLVGAAVAPMFPGYLFVQVPPAQLSHRIARTPGIKSFVSFGDSPATLDGDAIRFLQNREGTDGVIRLGPRIGTGSEVRILRGPFRGLAAVVEEYLPARERIRVLMDLLHRSTPIEMPQTWVSPL